MVNIYFQVTWNCIDGVDSEAAIAQTAVHWCFSAHISVLYPKWQAKISLSHR